MDTVKNIAATARSLREQHRLTLEEAATRTGCSKPNIWAFEQGRIKNPSLTMLYSLAKGYGVSLVELLGEDIKTPRLHPLAMKIAVLIDSELGKRKVRA